MFNEPIYQHDGSYAKEHGELDQYRASMKLNIACKEAIETSIRSHFDGMHLEKAAVTEVMAQFSPKRVMTVLAATIQLKDWDGRFSRANKEWAQDYPVPVTRREGYDSRDAFTVQSHPAVLNGFISAFRRELVQTRKVEKPSALEQLRADKAESKLHPPVPKPSRAEGMER